MSQQIARERLEGQVSAQENMLSDVVTGLRRRPGAQARLYAVLSNTIDRDRLLGFETDISGVRTRVLLDTSNGFLTMYDANWSLLGQINHAYLIGGTRADYQAATVGDSMFILNKSKIPVVSGVAPGADPGVRGFFYIKTGAFNREYRCTIWWNGGPVGDIVYTTPDATAAGAAAVSTPEYIAQQLANQCASTYGMGVQVAGAYVFVTRGDASQVQIQTNMPTSYIQVSNKSYVLTPADLPAKLPPAADGYIVATGSLRAPTYFSYSYAQTAWLECGNYGSPGTIINMPGALRKVGGAYTFGTSFEGRLAGDDVSNPTPPFAGVGITGMGSFQNRLVLLAGNMVCFSASGNPYRFYRSTVTNLVANDPISVGASGNSSAAYQHCVPFQKDLLLFASKYQALVPGGGVLTPSNATVVVTSTYEADMTGNPMPLGRTLMYPAPRSQDFFGILEMVPSQYTDSQYLSSDVTAHLPKYLPGRCRFAVSSSVANIAVFGSTSDYRSLIVHEYQWDGDTKVQQAWHRWTFPYDIADVFFSGSEIQLLFMSGHQLMVGTIDPRIGTLTAQAERRPYLDLWGYYTVANNTVVLTGSTYQNFDPLAYQKLKLADASPDLAGEEVGIDSASAASLITVPSFDAGQVAIGFPYRSSFSPTTPVVKDSNGVVISSNKLTLLRYMIGTANSYEYEAIVSDAASDSDDTDMGLSTLYWGSAELDLGHPRINVESTAILPCRTNAATTTLMLYTDGLGEMNIISLEYVCRYNQKLRRR